MCVHEYALFNQDYKHGLSDVNYLCPVEHYVHVLRGKTMAKKKKPLPTAGYYCISISQQSQLK